MNSLTSFSGIFLRTSREIFPPHIPYKTLYNLHTIKCQKMQKKIHNSKILNGNSSIILLLYLLPSLFFFLCRANCICFVLLSEYFFLSIPPCVFGCFSILSFFERYVVTGSTLSLFSACLVLSTHVLCTQMCVCSVLKSIRCTNSKGFLVLHIQFFIFIPVHQICKLSFFKLFLNFVSSMLQIWGWLTIGAG